jgi:hypothetical protein
MEHLHFLMGRCPLPTSNNISRNKFPLQGFTYNLWTEDAVIRDGPGNLPWAVNRF